MTLSPAFTPQARPANRRERASALIAQCSRPHQPAPPTAGDCSTSYASPHLPRRALLAGAALLPLAARPRPAVAVTELPRGYTDTARSLVDALRDSIDADLSGAPEREVRRKADPAKDLVRRFVGEWRDAAVVRDEESYVQLSAAIQELGQFYAGQGQRARLSERVGLAVLARLEAAEGALPPPPERKSLLPFPI
jgi:hypothetical protein